MINKHIETKQETITKEVVDSVVCDLCKREFKNRSQGIDGEVEWEYLPDVANTTVSSKKGLSLPEYGNTKRQTWHVCPECFEGKLVPWLEQQGAVPTLEEGDW